MNELLTIQIATTGNMHTHTHLFILRTNIYLHIHTFTITLTHKHTHKNAPLKDVCTVYVTRQSGSPDRLTSAPLAAVTILVLVWARSSRRVSSHRVRIRDLVTPLSRVRLPEIYSGIGEAVDCYCKWKISLKFVCLCRIEANSISPRARALSKTISSFT